MKIVSIILFLALGYNLGAQLLIEHQEIGKEPSYFISFDRDTIYGEVSYGKKLFGGLLNKICFTRSDGSEFVLRANESNGFSLNGQQYESKLIDDYYFFLRPAVKGKPSLYYLEHNYVERNDNSSQMIRLHSSYGRMITNYVEMNGRMHKVYRKRFKKQAEDLFSSYPEVLEMVNNDKLDFFDLEEIITYCNKMNEGLISPN
ncbi:MAG: hypothetical protein HKN45_11150 [Flavobacteriales bacterium]|nr:hypothetical protein [Flavobacteriales bacterium]NNK79989.1 hypothetical protein [Flavobacteriales bacterium]